MKGADRGCRFSPSHQRDWVNQDGASPHKRFWSLSVRRNPLRCRHRRNPESRRPAGDTAGRDDNSVAVGIDSTEQLLTLCNKIVIPTGADPDFLLRVVALRKSIRLSEKKRFHPSTPMLGCPILRVVGEGWDKQNLRGKGFGGRAVVSHISQKTSEMWGTRALVATRKRKRQTFDRASPRLYQPTYAGANVGHPDRVGERGRVDDHASFHPPVGRQSRRRIFSDRNRIVIPTGAK